MKKANRDALMSAKDATGDTQNLRHATNPNNASQRKESSARRKMRKASQRINRGCA